MLFFTVCSGECVLMHSAGLSTDNEQLSDDSVAPAHVRFSMLNGSKSGATSISEADDSSRGSGGRIDSQVGPATAILRLVSWNCSVDVHDDSTDGSAKLTSSYTTLLTPNNA